MKSDMCKCIMKYHEGGGTHESVSDSIMNVMEIHMKVKVIIL